MPEAARFGKRGDAITAAARGLVAAPPATRAPAQATFALRVPWVTLAIGVVLVAVFAAEQKYATDFSGPLAPGHFSLLALGGSDRALVMDKSEWWRLFTAPFLHGGMSHILGNLVALIAAGLLLEPLIGAGWFAALYLLGALGGALASLLLNPATMPSVGASGAIMACLAALFVCSYHVAARRPRLMRYLACGLLFPALLPSVAAHGGSVDINAHMGGAVVGTVFGFLILILWSEDEPAPGAGMIGMALAGMLLAVSGYAFTQVSQHYASYAAHGGDFMPPGEIPTTPDAIEAQSYALVERYPRDPRAHYFRGISLLQKNDASDAEAQLREALRLSEGNADSLTPQFIVQENAVLALDLALLGRKDEGRAHAAAFCADPQDEPNILEALKDADLCPG
ncbi:MAG TPA: rhomboid family intramembrane serine protease [Rhizomicrobium sp.]|nr:rhomboid family intramembrane serine protease [Rhizomicrobium sp.]